MEAGELTQRILILRAEHDVGVERRDRLRASAIRLIRRREIAPCVRVLGVRLDPIESIGDRRNAVGAAPREDVADPRAGVVRADAEHDERDGKREREKDEDPLGVTADPDEEHRVLDALLLRALSLIYV